MKNKFPANLTIRSAIVRSKDLGNIIGCDIKKEKDGIAHAYIYKWQAGNFLESGVNFDAHAICLIKNPESAVIFISSQGEYGVHYKAGAIADDIFQKSYPKSKRKRFGGFRSLSEIDGYAYAVGFGGMVYRLDKLDIWTRIDEGLPESFEIEAIHGFNERNIYAIGDDGEMWHFDGKKWTLCDLPTNAKLNAIRCVQNDMVYIVGQDGVIIRGKHGLWKSIDHEETKDDLWDVQFFNGNIYISSMSNLYILNKEILTSVDFGGNRPKSCYKLSCAKNILWSIGEYDIVSFDGESWERVV